MTTKYEPYIPEDPNELPLYQIKNALTKDQFIGVREELRRWDFTNGSARYDGTTGLTFLGKTVQNTPHLMNAGTILGLKIRKFVQKDLRLVRIHCNLKTFGDITEFHRDFREDFMWTAVLFTEHTWDSTWGGQLVVQDPRDQKLHAFQYTPNSAVVLPSNWWHCGHTPCHSQAGKRTSIGYSYCPRQYAHDIFRKYPQHRQFS